MSVEDAAMRLGVSTKTVRRMLIAGQMAIVRVRRSVRVRVDEIEALIHAGGQ